MAERFLAGGRLLAFGVTPAALSDVQHVAVEFVHPVIVGKRALPAIGLCEADQLALLAEPSDIVMVFGEPEDGGGCLREVLSAACARACLTVAFSELGADWEFELGSDDPFIRQELAEVTYHVLWELVHVFFEHRGTHSEGAGASSFLYPFLSEERTDPEAVIADVRESVLMKADEVQHLRERTVIDSADALLAGAASLHDCFEAGGRVLALGNGGSATDAVDLVADLLAAGHPAIDLTASSAIITAIANDIGSESIFARQVIAYGRDGDVLVALSTSGNSLSVIAALEEAGRRRMARIAFVGYDGGRVASEHLAEHVVITPSQHIPRIQEAQATAYHVLTTMVKSTK
ncbi:MAG: D-sedoheptulose-7-phosphate isomerase [Solirubrobacteraceae bacterium]